MLTLRSSRPPPRAAPCSALRAGIKLGAAHFLFVSMMSPALETLICDVPELASGLHTLDHEAAGGNPHTAALLSAIEWIATQPRSVTEKLTAIAELLSLPSGFVHIPSMREFCGWRDA